MDYETSSGITGTTDSNGYFNYREGDTITFKIGGLILGDAKGDSIITPTALYADNAGAEDIQDKAISLSALLMALDADPNDEVITIPETVKEAFKDIAINFESTDQLDITVNIDGDGTEENLDQLIEEYKDDASQHYTNTLYSLVEDALRKMKGSKVYFYNLSEGYASCNSCELNGYADGYIDMSNCTADDMNGTHSIYIRDGVLWQEPDGSNLMIVSADPGFPKVCVLAGDYNVWCMQKGEPPADCKKEDDSTTDLEWKMVSAQELYNFFVSAGKIWGYDRILFECNINVVDEDTIYAECINVDTGETSNNVTLDLPADEYVPAVQYDGIFCYEDGMSDSNSELVRCLFDETKIPLPPLYKQGKDTILSAIAGKIWGRSDGAIKFNADGTGVYCDRKGLEQGDYPFTYEIICETSGCYIHIPKDNEEDDYIRPLYADSNVFAFQIFYYPDDDKTQEFIWNNDILEQLDECPPITDPIQDYSHLTSGTVSGIQISDTLKIRIVPDANWQERSYDGIVCDINPDGTFGNACILWADNESVFSNSNECQVIVFEDLDDNWRYDENENSVYGTQISCNEISNLIIDINSTPDNNTDTNNDTQTTQIIDLASLEQFFTTVSGEDVYLLAGEFQIRQVNVDTASKRIEFLEFTYDGNTEPAFTLTYWEENGSVYVKGFNESPNAINPVIFKYDDKILCVEQYGVASDTSYIHTCIANPSQNPIIQQGASTVESAIQGAWIDYRLNGEQRLCLQYQNGTVYFYEYSNGNSGQASYTVRSININGQDISVVVINTGEEDISIFPLFYDGNSIYYYIMWFKAGTEDLTDAELRKLVPTSSCP